MWMRRADGISLAVVAAILGGVAAGAAFAADPPKPGGADPAQPAPRPAPSATAPPPAPQPFRPKEDVSPGRKVSFPNDI